MTGKRFALIIATSHYQDPDLQKLIAPAHDAEVLADLLKDIEIGKFEEVKILLDEPSYKITREIEKFFRERNRDDLLLLYFSCHGMKDDEGHLYFAAFDTYRKELYSTAISADFVNMIMSRSRSKRQVLLLDCCYSGAFAKGMIAKGADKEVHTKEHFDGHGRIILTASDAMQYSFEGDELKGVGVAECSIFTQAIVQGLKTGDADLDNDGNISPDELYDYTFDLVRRKTPLQKPGKWALGVEGDITIASTETTKNRKEEQQPLKLLEEGRIDEFNKIRKLKDVPLYFKKIDQSYKDLHGADLHDVDFTGAKLINTKLRMANLNGANFRDADLSGAELRGAELYRADLSGANLTNADLRNADLKGMIDFTGANLTAADLRGADLKGIINFADATLYDVNFTGANITKGLVNFRGAKIRNVVGLSADLYIYNKYVKDLRAFGALIEKQFKSLSISSEDLKNVEESIKELEKEIEDIDGERLTETRKRDIKTKLVTVLEKITGIILIENENTLNDFVSLNSFNELIGEDILSVLHSLKGFRRTNMYLEGLRSFSEAIQEQFSVNNISSEQLVPIKEGIKELEKELEDVLDPKTINSIKREELKTKLIELVRKVIETLPKRAESHVLFTHLLLFNKLLGIEIQQSAEEIKNNINSRRKDSIDNENRNGNFHQKEMATVNNINNETISSSRYGAIGYMYKQSSNRGNDANIQASDTHSHAPIYPRKIFDKLHSKFAKAEDPKGIFNRDSEAVNDSPQCSPLTSTILNWNKILGKNARSKDMDDIGTVTGVSHANITICGSKHRTYDIPKKDVKGFDGSEVEINLSLQDLYFLMNDPVQFQGRNVDLEKLIENIKEYLCKNNFQTSLFNNRINSESRFLLQAINAGSSKGSKGSSIDITIKGTSNDFAITVTAGKWGENTLLADSLYCMSGIAAAKKFSSFIFGSFEKNLWNYINAQVKLLQETQ